MTQYYVGVKIVLAWRQNLCGIEVAARAAHEANRHYCQGLGDNSQATWENAPEWQKASARAGVQQIIDNPNTTPAESHASWMARKVIEGWVYGDVKDVALKTHPCILPYNQLPEAQRIKDDIFGKVVRESLAKHPAIEPGYAVKYEDGYTSWSPKDVFERTYLPMGPTNDNKVTPEMVDAFVGQTCSAQQIDEKTTLVKVETLTGFRQYEPSSCVDPANYNHEIGTQMGLRRIKDRLWMALGFVVQWGRFGLANRP